MHFPWHSLQRLASIGVVALVAWFTPEMTTWLSVVIGVAIGHYLLSLFYAKSQIARVCGNPRTLVPLVVVTLAAALSYAANFSLLIVFGVHHVFNEVYLRDRALHLPDTSAASRFRLASIVLNFFIYFAAVRHYPDLQFIPPAILFAGLIAAYCAFFATVIALRQSLTPVRLVDACFFELFGLALIAFSFSAPIRVFHVSLYHFVFWGIYPLSQMASRSRTEMWRYIALNIGATAAGIAISPIGFLPFHFGMPLWIAQFRFVSFVHIFSSFAISRAHPQWITRWFETRAEIALQPVAVPSNS